MKRLSDDTVRVTVRIPRALFEEISRHGVNVSQTIRESIERWLRAPTDVSPALPERPGRIRTISTVSEARAAVPKRDAALVKHHPAYKCATCQAQKGQE